MGSHRLEVTSKAWPHPSSFHWKKLSLLVSYTKVCRSLGGHSRNRSESLPRTVLACHQPASVSYLTVAYVLFSNHTCHKRSPYGQLPSGYVEYHPCPNEPKLGWPEIWESLIKRNPVQGVWPLMKLTLKVEIRCFLSLQCIAGFCEFTKRPLKLTDYQSCGLLRRERGPASGEAKSRDCQCVNGYHLGEWGIRLMLPNIWWAIASGKDRSPASLPPTTLSGKSTKDRG